MKSNCAFFYLAKIVLYIIVNSHEFNITKIPKLLPKEFFLCKICYIFKFKKSQLLLLIKYYLFIFFL